VKHLVRRQLQATGQRACSRRGSNAAYTETDAGCDREKPGRNPSGPTRCWLPGLSDACAELGKGVTLTREFGVGWRSGSGCHQRDEVIRVVAVTGQQLLRAAAPQGQLPWAGHR
jgi:hypothetical protein